jgi:hypothetical protein
MRLIVFLLSGMLLLCAVPAVNIVQNPRFEGSPVALGAVGGPRGDFSDQDLDEAGSQFATITGLHDDTAAGVTPSHASFRDIDSLWSSDAAQIDPRGGAGSVREPTSGGCPARAGGSVLSQIRCLRA